ncbi:MAG TPA: hypothetical protein VFG83_14655 [Kofleriaceae bacterium]|nr:hypothetical protein [Kofleriaceae bacterium]
MSGVVKRLADWALSFHREFGDVHPLTEHWRRLSAMPATERLIGAIGIGLGKPCTKKWIDVANEEAQSLILSLCGWVQDGLNAFFLDDQMIAALLSTDVTRDMGDVRLPFRTQLVVVPDGWAGITGKNGRQFSLTAFWLSQEIGEKGPQAFMRSAMADADAPNLYTWRYQGDWLDYDAGAVTAVDMSSSDDRAMDFMVRLSSSFAAWIATNPTGVRRRAAPKSKRQRRTQDRRRPTRWHIAVPLRIPAPMVQAAKIGANAGTHKARKLSLQHIVRGHYKQQPHGPRGKLRKHVWVAPYWRGPDSREAWSRHYIGHGSGDGPETVSGGKE